MKRKNSPSFQSFRESNPIIWLVSLWSGSRQLIRKMYDWVIGWAEKKQAERALAALSFAESSFFPIPPDPLLIAMVTARPHKYIRLALICTIASVAGGVLGYVIGAGLYETVGKWLIDTYHLQTEFVSVGELYANYTFWAVLIAGFTPIPYKLFSISAGVFAINLPLFVLASFFGRGGRFFLVAILMHYFGKRYKDKIEKYIDYLGFAFIALVILGVVAVKYLF